MWEYGPSLYPHDPAGGSEHWAELIKNPGNYYMTDHDIKAILRIIKDNNFFSELSHIKTVIELGPGSHEAVENKTIPFLETLKHIKKYIAVDATLEQAKEAASFVQKRLGIPTGVREQNFAHDPLIAIEDSPRAIIMWGSTLGNIEGGPNTNPFPKLVTTLENFKKGLDNGDMIVLCHDTETDSKKILAAYNEPALHAQVLSILYRLKRDGYVTGNFEPSLWRHEPVWYKDVGQCAHMVYPLFDQTFTLAGQEFNIPAWTRFISNNSYKISQSVMYKAAACAGLTAISTINQGPVALSIMQVTF